METAMATLILLFGLGSGHNCLVGSQLAGAAFWGASLRTM
jgi:hypothetical protein